MNILHMKYAVEVAKAGSISKASEVLLTAMPNISRSIKKLESDLGITIFDRTTTGMKLTPDGEEFLNYAKETLSQIDRIEKYYKEGNAKRQRFSISVPRSGYISEAFAAFSKTLTKDAAELFYKETSTQQTINNILHHQYKLGVIRYGEEQEQYFKMLLKEKEFCHETVAEFTYSLVMHAEHPLAQKEEILCSDLIPFIEVTHAEPYVPFLSHDKRMQQEGLDFAVRRIFAYDRASQLELLSKNPETYLWVSTISDTLLEQYHLVRKKCADYHKIYHDVLIYPNWYKLTDLDENFITELYKSKEKYL